MTGKNESSKDRHYCRFVEWHEGNPLDAYRILVTEYGTMFSLDPAQIKSLWEDVEFELKFREKLDEKIDLGQVFRANPSDKMEETQSDGPLDAILPSPGEGFRFRLNEVHDSGGLGVVWKAADLQFDRQVAVKQIRTKFSKNRKFRRKFKREALITARLEHPGIVPVYSVGEHQTELYYAMKFVGGKTFSSAIDDFHESPVSGRERIAKLKPLLRRFVDLCNTIEYAHENRVIHRDIKPANVLLGEFGETLVVDWGLAKSLNAPVSIANGSFSACWW